MADYRTKNIIVQNLCLELTRQCNLQCKHCMVGVPSCSKMSNQVIERVFDDVKAVNCLQFTGGETSLAVDRLQKVVEEVYMKQPKINAVMIFTNATNVTDEYIDCLVKLQDYCINLHNQGKLIFTEENMNYDYTGLVPRLTEMQFPLKVIVSLDKYHLWQIDQTCGREQVKKNIEKLIKYFPVEIDKGCNYDLFDEGRAENILNAYKVKVPKEQYAVQLWGNSEEIDVLIGPWLNISHDGKIIPTNHTYQFADSHATGDIVNQTLYDMIKQLDKKRLIKYSYTDESYYNRIYKISHQVNTTTKQLRAAEKFNKKHRVLTDRKYLTSEGYIPGYQELDEPPYQPE